MSRADDIAGRYLGGDAARPDLGNHILEYGEDMALAAIKAERAACAAKAREFAALYDQGSDGRNTFILLAEWIESRASGA